MKKILCIALTMCMILSMAGCSLLNLVSMEVKDMVNIPDDEMIVVLLMEFGIERFENLNESQKAVYTAAALEMEVLNGGTVQFLSNEGRNSAYYVCDALELIGATEHLSLLQQTLAENHVDLKDLSTFVTEDTEAFSKLYDQYDFEVFDSAYENLPSIPDLIRDYINAHTEDFENKKRRQLPPFFTACQKTSHMPPFPV